MKDNDNSILTNSKHFAISMDLLFMDGISADAKLLYVYINDSISYSEFKENGIQYWYLSSKHREELISKLNFSNSKFKRLVAELRDNHLIRTKQVGAGVRFYHGINPSVAQICTSGSSNMVYPLNYISIKSRNINSTPTLEEVEFYFFEQGFLPTGLRFYEHYSSKNWTCNEQPIKDWHKLAYVWNQNQFVSLPHEFYNASLEKKYYDKLPSFVQHQVDIDQAEGKGKVRLQTLNMVLESLGRKVL